MLAQNLSDREIADRLVLAYTTVKWYNRQIFSKLSVARVCQLVHRMPLAIEIAAAWVGMLSPRLKSLMKSCAAQMSADLVLLLASGKAHSQRANGEKRMEEIKELMKRIDFGWENCFMDEEEYLQKRRQLQLEIETMRPVKQDELLKSADLLKNFRGLWERCMTPQAQHELIKQIVDGVVVLDKEVIALALKGDTALLVVNDNDILDYGERGIFSQSGIIMFPSNRAGTMRRATVYAFKQRGSYYGTDDASALSA